MRILVSGASGMIGRATAEALRAEGHNVARLVRPGGAVAAGDVRWDPSSGRMDREAAEGADAVIHLAGASIAGGRWTKARKAILRASRVDATRHLVAELATLARKPRILVSASAVGYYGERGEETLTEASGPGNDFLAELCQRWETESVRAEQAGIRSVQVRFGIVLANRGGALGRMLLPFRLGLGGRIASGRQWMPWVTLADVVRILHFATTEEGLRGAVNGVSPNPVRNAEFTQMLARVLRRPAVLPVPAFALRLMLGEMADGLLLRSQRAMPRRLLSAGFHFQYEELEAALRGVLR